MATHNNSTNLRVSSNSDEILSIIMQMNLDLRPITIWQFDPDTNKRSIYRAIVSHIDFTNDLIILRPANQKVQFNLKDNLTFYCKGEHKSILFKQTEFYLRKKRIVVKIPATVRLFEQRNDNRENLDFYDVKLLIRKKINQSGSGRDFRVKAIDLSLAGASFFIAPKECVYFSPGETLNIVSIDQFSFKSPLKSKVIYLKSIDADCSLIKSERIRVGLKLDHPLDQELFESIKKHFKLSA